MFENIPLILAQEDEQPTATDPSVQQQQEGTEGSVSQGTSQNGTPGDQTPRSNLFGGMMFPLIIGIVLFWLILMGPQRREKKKRKAMLAALAKGNKIQTVGGILGTVIEVRDNDVIVKVDENANIRLRFARSSIQSIINESE